MARPNDPNESVISELEAGKLLDLLCVRHGFCLSPLWNARLRKNPPRSPEKFIDAVIRAEGLDPATVATAGLERMREMARQAFTQSAVDREPDV